MANVDARSARRQYSATAKRHHAQALGRLRGAQEALERAIRYLEDVAPDAPHIGGGSGVVLAAGELGSTPTDIAEAVARLRVLEALADFEPLLASDTAAEEG